MTEFDERLALDVLGLLDEPNLLEAAVEVPVGETVDGDRPLADPIAVQTARAELEQTASWLASSVEPITPPDNLRARLLAELGGRERLSPFIDRVAALFDLAEDRARAILALFDTHEGWIGLWPGAAFFDLQGGPALGEATAGLVRIAAGLSFPHHRHIGEERLLVLQGAFVDGAGQRVGPGELVVMADGSEHGFEVVSAQELLYAVVVHQVEFADGTRAP